jgi:hypothetical protein
MLLVLLVCLVPFVIIPIANLAFCDYFNDSTQIARTRFGWRVDYVNNALF